MPHLTPDETDDLSWYFGPGQTVSARSTFGPQLARAETLYRTSDGRVVDARRTTYALRELAERASDGSPKLARVLTPWAYLTVKREAPPAVEPEDRDEQLQELARLSRRVQLLGANHRATLADLYGDEGARWSREKQGRIWVLVPRQRLALAALASDERRRLRKGKPAPAVTAAERLALLATSAQQRPIWLDSALDGAERDEAAAYAAWRATG